MVNYAEIPKCPVAFASKRLGFANKWIGAMEGGKDGRMG